MRLPSLPRWVQDYAIVAVVAAVVVGWIASNPAAPPLPAGEAAPALHLTRLDGQDFDLEAHRGQPTLVVFWAEWCGACKSQVDDLNRLHAEHPEVPLLGVAVDSGDDAAVARHVKRHGIDFPVAVGDSALQRSFGVTALPTNVFVAADGTVAEAVVGALDYRGFRSRLD